MNITTEKISNEIRDHIYNTYDSGKDVIRGGSYDAPDPNDCSFTLALNNPRDFPDNVLYPKFTMDEEVEMTFVVEGIHKPFDVEVEEYEDPMYCKEMYIRKFELDNAIWTTLRNYYFEQCAKEYGIELKDNHRLEYAAKRYTHD